MRGMLKNRDGSWMNGLEAGRFLEHEKRAGSQSTAYSHDAFSPHVMTGADKVRPVIPLKWEVWLESVVC